MPADRREREHGAHHKRAARRPHSPERQAEASSKRHRGSSPSGRRQHHHRHGTKDKPTAVALPYNNRPLSLQELEAQEPLLAMYLDVQKQLSISDLDAREVKGRWKRFVHRWNRAELAEGWYLASTRDRAVQAYSELADRQPADGADGVVRAQPEDAPPAVVPGAAAAQPTSDSDSDEFAPAPAPTLAPALARASQRPMPRGRPETGPTVPGLDDLRLRDEMEAEDREHAREDRRHEVKKGRKEESALLDELAPRADPGSREKQLEKRRETSAAMRGFRDDKSPGAAEVGDKDLLGGDNDGLDGFKAKKKEMERKKNERQLRREEILRARAEVRELRLAKVKTQEDKTMAMLRQLAQKRWGNGPLDGPDEDGDTETGPVGRSDGPFL